MQNPQEVKHAVDTLRASMPHFFQNRKNPPIGIILGTGLSHLAHEISSGYPGARVPFSALPGFPLPGVDSHEGAFVLGCLGEQHVLVQQGRCHLYEGKSPSEVCMGVRVMHGLGITTLIITNAAGALNPAFSAGGLMCMRDFINFTGQSPLRGANCPDWGERFPDMSRPFDERLQELALKCALDLGIRLERGVYIGVHGPEMETPAETRMYRGFGADAIGMSTVLEVIAARHCGMRVLGLSCLTNLNLPDCMMPAELDEIIRVAESSGSELGRLLTSILERIGSL